MCISLYISTIEAGSGKSAVALGLIEYALRKTTRVGFFRPVIHEPPPGRQDEDIDLILRHFWLPQPYDASYAWTDREVDHLLGQDRQDEVLDRIIRCYKFLEQHCDFILCEGTDFLGDTNVLEFDFNCVIAKNLGCPVLMVGNAHGRAVGDTLHAARIAVDAYAERGCRVAGILLNKAEPEAIPTLTAALQADFGAGLDLLAVLPFDQKLKSPRVREVAEQLGAEVLFGHSRLDTLISGYLIAAMQVQNAITWLQPDQLVITAGDRADIVIGMMQADKSANYPRLAGIVLSGGVRPDPALVRLIEGSRDPLPVLLVKSDTFTTASRAAEVHTAMVAGDAEKSQRAIGNFDAHVDLAKLEHLLSNIRGVGMTPKMFTYNLVVQAKADRRHIVLPEGTDTRILRAAADLSARGIVEITLLGIAKNIEQMVRAQSIPLDLSLVRVVNPADSPQLERYAEAFHRLRKHKGATLETAREYMLDVSYYGTMMVYLGDADGMVSGAAHTTQHTIRPALQIIKTQPEVSIVSSVFFMCLDDGVVVYGDCAVNPAPDPEQLAEIAISSAETARTFGIEPRIALLSYSSGESGQGEDVEKVRKATRIARERRPDLKLEGPIQYDAAVDPGVAAQKMPGSEVAGRATVFVFPDLNTGNNTYKAVQRETGAIAIGPILQGLNKPVNDLSRGCTVEDIFNTVVITAIQAQKGKG
ncbi:phosphate acetyltransferase [Methylomagnum ishizawai]|uniref:phosphate acetyltransferase n=1 Tax=Methylomagnum ishizawai TaxID=1760988 RepID=UPI001C33C05D|nr:phosphate acetyltransferase [Methylomagnum ishizawai]BBL76424.1 phosphate acetyltransferase [Methylomagnum ishizawai]